MILGGFVLTFLLFHLLGRCFTLPVTSNTFVWTVQSPASQRRGWGRSKSSYCSRAGLWAMHMLHHPVTCTADSFVHKPLPRLHVYKMAHKQVPACQTAVCKQLDVLRQVNHYGYVKAMPKNKVHSPGVCLKNSPLFSVVWTSHQLTPETGPLWIRQGASESAWHDMNYKTHVCRIPRYHTYFCFLRVLFAPTCVCTSLSSLPLFQEYSCIHHKTEWWYKHRQALSCIMVLSALTAWVQVLQVCTVTITINHIIITTVSFQVLFKCPTLPTLCGQFRSPHPQRCQVRLPLQWGGTVQQLQEKRYPISPVYMIF